MILIPKKTPSKMKNKLLITALLAATTLWACSGSDSSQSEGEELVKKVNVVTQTIRPQSFSSYVRVVGTVETSNDIMISAEVSGKVVSYRVDEGDFVKKGQTILKIDDAKLKQEKARLEAVTAQAKENFERLKKIYEEDGIGSEIDYLNAKYSYEQSKSALESIKVDLANTNVTAPFNGKVESKAVNVGEMVAPGTPVVRLIGSDDYKITSGVPARYSDAVSVGDSVDVWFDTQVSDTLKGTIKFVGTSINAQNRTFAIEVDLPGAANKYKVDMIANLRLQTYQRNDVLVVSEEFVYSKDHGYVVYLAGTDEDGHEVAEEVPVVLGLSYKTEVIVEEGLSAGDKLITIGSAFLDEGTRIEVKDESSSNLASK